MDNHTFYADSVIKPLFIHDNGHLIFFPGLNGRILPPVRVYRLYLNTIPQV